MTEEQLRLIMTRASPARIALFLKPLNDSMYGWAIDEQKARIAAFLATVAVESGELRYVRELASGEAYEGRLDLGNTEPGDGRRFPGRGLIQNTGRANTLACSLALYGDDRLLRTPELLEEPEAAADSAGWFFAEHGCNELADAGDFFGVSKAVNGINRKTGEPNGYEQRVEYWGRAKSVFGVVA